MEPIQLTLLIVFLFFIFFIVLSFFSKSDDDVDEIENSDNIKIIEKEVIVDNTDYETITKVKEERDYFVNIADNRKKEIENLSRKIKELESKKQVVIQNNKIPTYVIEKAKELQKNGYFHIMITHDSEKEDIIKEYSDERYSVVVDKIKRTENNLGRYNTYIISKDGIKLVKLNRLPKEFSNDKK